MPKEAVYPYQVQFEEKGPTLQKQIELLLCARMKEVAAEWTPRR